MQGSYPVLFEDTNVGEAQIVKEGLYYNVHCSCKLSNDAICRLYLYNDAEKIDLGILIREQGEYVVRTKIAAKRLSHTNVVFRVISPNHIRGKDQIAIKPAEPFPCLAQLEQLRLIRQSDGFGAIYIKERSQSSEIT